MLEQLYALEYQINIGLFTTNANTISAGAKALRIISAGFIVSSVSVTASGALEGLGKGLPSLVISVFRYVVIIIPVAFILSRIYEVNGVWWSFGVTELVTAFISYIIYKRRHIIIKCNQTYKVSYETAGHQYRFEVKSIIWFM